jgi:cytochrome c
VTSRVGARHGGHWRSAGGRPPADAVDRRTPAFPRASARRLLSFAWIAAAACLLPVAAIDAQTSVATGDPEAGATVFKKCLACHKVGPAAKNGVGPILNGVVGRRAGTYPGYAYSDANKASGAVWNEATLAAYLPAPREFMPGTKMSFAGLEKPKDVADVIAYLKQFDDRGLKPGS